MVVMKFNKAIPVKSLERHLAEGNSANMNNMTAAMKVHKILRTQRHPSANAFWISPRPMWYP